VEASLTFQSRSIPQTMHQLILQTYDPAQWCPPHQSKPPALRMIANAAGGLLPSLAVQLREIPCVPFDPHL